MNGFDRFSEIFINRAKQIITEENLTNNPEYSEVFKNHILGLNGPKQLSRVHTPEEIFFLKLFNGFIEIQDSYYCLLDIEIYIGRFPYGNTKISKTRHMAYHMENYLNEIYILKERLKSYFTIIGRLYKKDERHQNILNKTRPLFKLITGLKGIVDTRGSHVHVSRFNDENLDRLKSQELYSDLGGEEFSTIGNIFKTDYMITRKKYKQILKSNNDQIKKMLDVCFDILFEIVADNDLNIKFPIRVSR